MADSQLEQTVVGIWESLTDEQRERAKACSSSEELMQLLGEEGIELPDDLLSEVAGGLIYRTPENKYEVINDKDGQVMSVEDSYEQAVEKARELGQSTSGTDWWTIAKLRGLETCR